MMFVCVLMRSATASFAAVLEYTTSSAVVAPLLELFCAVKNVGMSSLRIKLPLYVIVLLLEFVLLFVFVDAVTFNLPDT